MIDAVVLPLTPWPILLVACGLLLAGSRRAARQEAARARAPSDDQTMPSATSACSRSEPYACGVLYERRATNHHTVARISTTASAIAA